MWNINTYPNCFASMDFRKLSKMQSGSFSFLHISCSCSHMTQSFRFFYLFSSWKSLFLERPCIPVKFVIHECKFALTHQEMFKESVKRIPSFKMSMCPLPLEINKKRTLLMPSKTKSLISYCFIAGTTFSG